MNESGTRGNGTDRSQPRRQCRIAGMAQCLWHWIRHYKRHPNPWVRRALGVGLILGGFLAVLPVFGLWMLPLGLLILSDETSYLRRARRRIQIWAGRAFGTPRQRGGSARPTRERVTDRE